jgi:hypothetical protein
MVANAFPPFLGDDAELIGGNTYGKPVGQIALDRPACDDRLRVVAFQVENADGEGEYYSGLGDTMPVYCRASEDIFSPLGTASEAMIAEAGRFLTGGAAACSATSAPSHGANAGRRPETPLPPQPTVAQRDLPGLY